MISNWSVEVDPYSLSTNGPKSLLLPGGAISNLHRVGCYILESIEILSLGSPHPNLLVFLGFDVLIRPAHRAARGPRVHYSTTGMPESVSLVFITMSRK